MIIYALFERESGRFLKFGITAQTPKAARYWGGHVPDEAGDSVDVIMVSLGDLPTGRGKQVEKFETWLNQRWKGPLENKPGSGTVKPTFSDLIRRNRWLESNWPDDAPESLKEAIKQAFP